MCVKFSGCVEETTQLWASQTKKRATETQFSSLSDSDKPRKNKSYTVSGSWSLGFKKKYFFKQIKLSLWNLKAYWMSVWNWVDDWMKSTGSWALGSVFPSVFMGSILKGDNKRQTAVNKSHCYKVNTLPLLCIIYHRYQLDDWSGLVWFSSSTIFYFEIRREYFYCVVRLNLLFWLGTHYNNCKSLMKKRHQNGN